MENLGKFDGHCHLFNLWYLISELLTIGRDAIFGAYPRRLPAPPGAAPKAAPAAGVTSIWDLLKLIATVIRQISQLSRSMFNDYEDNYLLLRKNFLASFPDETELLAIPLMMDIYFMFVNYFEAPAAAAPFSAAASRPPEELFKEWFGGLRDELLSSVAAKRAASYSTYGSLLSDPDLARLEYELDALQSRLLGGPEQARGPLGQGPTGDAAAGQVPAPPCTVMTPGFEKEIRDSLALQAKYEGQVFPFLAVDPRRDGIMALLDEKGAFGVKDYLVSRNGPFYGIKLYPRLGYKPAEVEALGLFKWCSDRDIPITFHCNTGGFPPFNGWKWGSYSDPSLWEPILTDPRYKDANGGLRVDFAHYGDGDPAWRQKITDYATNKGEAYGKNVYTDIACYVQDDSMAGAKKSYDDNAGMKGKLLFGTDYDVMLLTGLVDLRSYYERFLRYFDDDASVEDLMTHSPRNFLNGAPGGSTSGGGGSGGAETGGGSGAGSSTEGGASAGRKLGREIRLGWLRDHPDARDFSIFTARLPSRQAELQSRKTVREMLVPLFRSKRGMLPSETDLRQWCSPVENQSQLGSCTANAAVGLVEYLERRANGRYVDASRLFLYKVSRKLLGWTGDTGAYLRTAMEALVLFGTPPEQYYPYKIESFDVEPEGFAYAFAQNYKTMSYFRLDPPGTRTQELLHAVKTALAAGYPSIFGFSVYDSMGEAASSGRVPYPAQRDSLRGGHAVMAVGYKDDLEIRNSAPGSTPTRGAVLFRNSWGGSWGEGGYGWLPYDYVLEGLAVDWWSIVKQEWVDTGLFA